VLFKHPCETYGIAKFTSNIIQNSCLVRLFVTKELESKKIGSSVSYSLIRVASGVRKINDYQFLSPHYRLIIDFFDTLSTNFIDFSIFRKFGPEPELNFRLK